MLATRLPTIALVGNPNTGKTTLFNALAGMKQHVGNYPGVTVETKKGKLRHRGHAFEVIDLPGTYSLAPRSPDEMVAVELLLGEQKGEPRPDVVITIVDASNLDRNLYLTTQVLEMGVPVVVALNMMDVAQAQGVKVDVARLAKNLGVPVVPLQANRGKGLEELKEAAVNALTAAQPPSSVPFPDAFEKEVAALQSTLGDGVASFLVRRALLDVGGQTEAMLGDRLGNGFRSEVQGARTRLAQAGCPIPAVEARTRYAWIRRATADAVQRPAERPVTWTDRLDRVLTHRIWGTVLFLALMFLVFQSIFIWAGPLMDLISAAFDLARDAVKDALDPGPLRSLLADGVIGGVGGVLVFLPQILILFAFIAVLEDCGYMARAAFLMDRLMSRCGLNGKSFIPLLSSMACAVPGIMSARVIENPRDRLTTILVAPLMSCSARLPVYLLLAYAFLGHTWWLPGLVIFAMYCIGLVLAPLIAFLLKRTLLRGETPVFVLEMPLYKVPSLRLVVRRSLDAGWMFVRRAGTLILASMILVWALLYFPVTTPDGKSYDVALALVEERDKLTAELDELKGDPEKTAEARDLEQRLAKLRKELGAQDRSAEQLESEWKSQSVLGRVGQGLEPAVQPLGWDWRIGMAALASFPAREVMVGTLGIIFGEGETDPGEEEARGKLAQALAEATWDDVPGGKPLFTVPTALSIMVFFALCCQCVSTLAVIKRETNSWKWPAFTFAYMTGLAYLGALLVYQVGSWLS